MMQEGTGRVVSGEKEGAGFRYTHEANSFFFLSCVVHSPDFIVGCLNKRALFCTNKLFFLILLLFLSILILLTPSSSPPLPAVYI